MFCKKCGAQVSDDANFCDKCGASLSDAQITPTTTPQATTAPKKKRHGCLFSVIIVIIFLLLIGVGISVGINQLSQEGQTDQDKNSAVEMTPERWLEFDSKTWEDFSTLYQSHNTFMTLMSNYSDNAIDAGTFYSECEKCAKWFGENSLTYDYGETQEEKDYLSAFESVALSDQMAAKSMMKYLDSKKASDLSDVEKNIDAAVQGITTIASNRGVLLVKAGLTDEEIQAKVESDMQELE